MQKSFTISVIYYLLIFWNVGLKAIWCEKLEFFFFLRIYSLMFSCHYVMGGQFIWIAFDVGAYSLTQEDQTRATINSVTKSKENKDKWAQHAAPELSK